MITEIIKSIMPEMQEELKRILQFWIDGAIDNKYGGFVGEINSRGEHNEHAEKGVVLNSRILWTFAAAYNFYSNPEYLRMADRAYQFLIQHFWDTENGGLFWSLNPDGSVKNRRKQAYAHGFGVYGLSEYYRATLNNESLNYAITLYNLIETYFKDAKQNGYIEALSDNWEPLSDMRLSDKDANEPKSMNTHLHIIEAYTNLYKAWPDEDLKKQIHGLLKVFSNTIIDQQTSHFKLFFDMDWTVKSDILSYGHDIEGAWLLNEAVHVSEATHLTESIKKAAVSLVDATLTDGVDKDGSLFYHKEKGHLDTDKHWWPQAEALVGLIDAWQQTNNDKYLEAAERVWVFIKEKLIDIELGEWLWKVDVNGYADSVFPKVGFWKCPYHNSRALMEVINRIQTINHSK